MNIYIGNLSPNATDGALREAFEAFGQVTSVRIIKDKYTSQSRGFAFVEMTNQAEAQAAIRGLNGKDLLGKPISVSEGRSPGGKKPGGQGRSGRPGGRMDYSGRKNRY